MAESLSSASPGGCVYVFLRRNDGNDATHVRAEQDLKVQYFYWCFPFTGAKIGLLEEHARKEMVF
ncbi:hypothetical protein SAMN03080598_02856 [Algoriphagus boritolerans DSM 17298 = JCM 18970]|uniref:Uncharacterized protein n=1 Tax=Algoriphagus boritolerans DSM 17298 = JCM 18970 TaxID=1120964 RepID=A0A1H5Y7P9_9BACT|nr:hypothetical protein SAMN03080598_02856 [Algoriphagus boritolerans DSM 17298 = JCM 18970]